MSTGEQNPEAQLRELRAYAEHRGFPITREPINRFGDYVLDMSKPPAPLPFTLPQRQQAACQTTETVHV